MQTTRITGSQYVMNHVDGMVRPICSCTQINLEHGRILGDDDTNYTYRSARL